MHNLDIAALPPGAKGMERRETAGGHTLWFVHNSVNGRPT
jgi:hypothetical protein